MPNLAENRLNITIDEGDISIEGDVAQIIERKDAKGNVVGKQQRQQSVSKHVSIPADADHENENIEHQKDAVIVTLPKKA